MLLSDPSMVRFLIEHGAMDPGPDGDGLTLQRLNKREDPKDQYGIAALLKCHKR